MEIPELKNHVNNIKAFCLAEKVLKEKLNEVTKDFMEYQLKPKNNKHSKKEIKTPIQTVVDYIEDKLEIPTDWLNFEMVEKGNKNMKEEKKAQTEIERRKCFINICSPQKIFMAFNICFIDKDKNATQFEIFKDQIDMLSDAIFDPYRLPEKVKVYLNELIEKNQEIMKDYEFKTMDPSTSHNGRN
uniref:Uncharacterized protein n=1 Tax=Meloidogyne hapla TaxID=6305 RepID=A0A1I8B8K9_MELHA